jgi:hypothetical protein
MGMEWAQQKDPRGQQALHEARQVSNALAEKIRGLLLIDETWKQESVAVSKPAFTLSQWNINLFSKFLHFYLDEIDIIDI